MKQRLIVYILFPIILFSLTCCTSRPDGKSRPDGISRPDGKSRPAGVDTETPVTPLPENRLDILEVIRRNISVASPDTLITALSLLEENPEGASETGRDLSVLAGILLQTAYPLSLGSRSFPPPSAGSLWGGIYATVRSGTFPVIPQENVSFFTSLVSPLALLYSNSPQVWIQCGEILEQLRVLNPRSVLPVYLLGELAEKRREIPAALEYYKAAVEMDPSCYPAETGIARIQVREGNAEGGVKILEKQAGQFPGSPWILEFLGRAYLAAGSPDLALGVVTDALLILPESTSLLFLRARILENLGRQDQARRILSIVERTMPNDPEVLLLKARLAVSSGDKAGAVLILQRALELNPGREDIKSAYGALLLETGDGQAGRDLLKQQLAADSSSLASLELLLKDAAASGDWDRAAEYSDRLLELRRDLSDLILAGEIALAREDFARADALADEMYGKFPGDSRVGMIYIQSLFRRNRLAEARRIIQEALAKETGSSRKSELYYFLSLTIEDINGKIEALRNALLENLENHAALVSMSRIYSQREDFRNALRYMKQAYLLDPKNQEVYREMQELEKKLP